ncbi:MAG: UDP-N-acetylmuramoyl-tripeptide--D-alanyl-D-alanine ligase [Casimicrobiaceae bacterium]
MMDTMTAARAVEGRLLGSNVSFTRVVTDSRALDPGDLFVALSGERFDGHAFVADAFAQGAAAALVASGRNEGLPGPLVAVTDPLVALGRLAAYWRRQFALPLALIAGSNGKTTVKEMLASILREHFTDDAVLATKGNYNNVIGLPLTLLRLRAPHRAAVIEVGVNHRGETRELAALSQPTLVLINNAQREHQEFLRGVAEVAAEHADAILALAPGSVAIINADDVHAGVWREAARAVRATITSFGLDAPADVTARFSLRPNGSDVELATKLGEARIALAVPGRHTISNALAATAAALAMGASLAAVVSGLERFRAVAGRLVARHSPLGALVFDDTYNANPDSVRAAVDVLAAVPGKKWLVLGDMGEVGDNGRAFHREIGAYAQAVGIDALFGLGEFAADAVAAFGSGARHFATADELTEQLLQLVQPDVTVLVKGSRFMRMERVVAKLSGDATARAH